MLDQNPALRPSITEVVEILATRSGFRSHCCRLETSLRSSTKREVNVTDTNNVESTSHVNPGAVESKESQPRSSICSNGKVPDSPFSNRYHSIVDQDSALEDEVTSQEHSLTIVKGHKRALTEALSDLESGPLPTGQSRTDFSGSDTPCSRSTGETDVEEEDQLLRAELKRVRYENEEKDMRLRQLEQAVIALQQARR
jgi:hypothetical protein